MDRVKKSNVSGLLQYPDYGLLKVPQADERWLYAQRGLFRYNVGDLDGAWNDFYLASGISMRNN